MPKAPAAESTADEQTPSRLKASGFAEREEKKNIFKCKVRGKTEMLKYYFITTASSLEHVICRGQCKRFRTVYCVKKIINADTVFFTLQTERYLRMRRQYVRHTNRSYN